MARHLMPLVPIAVALGLQPLAAQERAGEADPGAFAFFDPQGGMQLAEGACGEGSAEWLNTTMMDLDGTWTMEVGPPQDGAAPLAGAGSDVVVISASAGDRSIALGGAAFAAEVPLRAWQGGDIPFAELPGGLDLTSSGATAALGCAFDRLPRLTARGVLSAENGAAPFVLAVAVPNARSLLGVLRTGEGEGARTRLVRILR
ncbi:hypothetical protein P6F26_12115 [Roseibacterium sp. SDUM158017]|uniref:hypothetical protein n=1 Tax=Roseicyclus salinarum TaxID=3036773 RepID=UPI0024158469|nr:hypothetical protein [Roseibacterium sp. SDUM158017]MDG4649194.1 hypothetical protein [Roseibacterium sp. SDUM158017]